MSTPSIKAICTALFCMLVFQYSFAHNGSIAYAYPLGNIKVDGDLSDWPKDATKYTIGLTFSDAKPTGATDFSGVFQLGYRLDNRSLYIAFTITDDSFIEDTSQNVRWNTQDGLELNIDARHLLSGSGVASFMYSKKLRNINNAFYDSFAKNASWDIAEVVMVAKGNTRYYEWRIQLGDELAVGKSIGFDVQVFDMDADKSFSYTAWGKGSPKYMFPASLGDIIPLRAGEKLSELSGNVAWDKPMKTHLPAAVRIVNMQNRKTWVQAQLDSMGKYSVKIPGGKYELLMPDAYFYAGDTVYATTPKTPQSVLVKAGEKSIAPGLIIPGSPAPDLLPDKGVLLNFTAANGSS